MPNAEVQVSLRGGEPEGTYSRYQPGAPIQGSVMIRPEADLECRSVQARLIWHTEGTGDRDEGVIAEQVLHQGLLRANTPMHFSFSFTAAQEPWSYAGHHIHIIWEVEVIVDVPWAKDVKGAARFVLHPNVL